MPDPSFSAGALTEWMEGISWASPRVLLCGAVGVVLLVLALLLRGVQKLVIFAAFASLLLGGYWWVRETWGGPELLPPELRTELDRLAARTLENEEAQKAWQAIQGEWGHLTGERRDQLLGGGDAAREAIGRRLDAKAAELRKKGQRTAAAELVEFRREVAP